MRNGERSLFFLSVPAPEDHGNRIAKVPGPILPVKGKLGGTP